MSTENGSTETIEARVQDVLVDAGYKALTTPLSISGIPFEVPYALVAGSGFIDLVLILNDRQNANDEARKNFWLVERIARALDNAGSRRPLSVVLISDSVQRGPATMTGGTTDALLRLARVLVVNELGRVEEQLAPMLPLTFEPATALETDPLGRLVLTKYHARDQSQVRKLVAAARQGPDVVENVFASWLDGAFGASKGVEP